MDNNLVSELKVVLDQSRYISKDQRMKELFEKLPGQIDYPTSIQLASNSVFFFEELDWDNQDENRLEFKLVTFISNLVGKCVNYKIMSQSWRLFSVISYLLFQGRRVQATSLMDSCYRLAIINYASDGILENCQAGLNLLWQVPGKGNYDTSLEGYYSELSSKLNCSDCIERDKGHKYKYPCYHILEVTYKTVFSHFLSYWYRLSNKSTWKDNDLGTITKKFYRSSEDSYEWKGIISRGRNEAPTVVDNYPVFDGRQYLQDKGLNAITIGRIRNALAHGNLKEPSDIVYNDSMTLIDKRICDSYILLLDFLLFLTKDAFVEHRGKIVTGKHLFLAFHELDNYEDQDVTIFQDLSILRTYSFAKHLKCRKKPLVKDRETSNEPAKPQQFSNIKFGNPPATVAWSYKD